MRILVIGCGSIGQRHIRLLRQMGETAIGCDTDPKAVEATGSGHTDLRDALAHDWDGAIIATPPHMHCDHALACMRPNACGPVLIEKPLCITIADAKSLALPWRPPILVGYCLRFHPGLRKLKALLESGVVGMPLCARIWCSSYLPDWRPGIDYRKGYAARIETGGGVLLDCSHELDYACWLFGEPQAVTCVTAHSGALEIETEDVADVIVRFASGVQASIHLSYVQRYPQRGCFVTCGDGSLEWDFEWYSIIARQRWPEESEAYLRTTHFADEVDGFHTAGRLAPWRCQPDDLYHAELQHFLAVCRGETAPACTAQDGLRAMKCVLAAHESAKTGRTVMFT